MRADQLTDPPDPSRATAVDYDDRDLCDRAPDRSRLPNGRRTTRPARRYFGGIERGLRDQLARSLTIELPANTDLKLYGRPASRRPTSRRAATVPPTTRAATEIAKLRDKYEAKATRIRDEIAAAEDRVDVLQAEAHGKRNDELLSTAGSILGDLLGGRSRSRALRPLGSAAGRRGRTAAAGERVDAAQGKVGRLHDELEEPRGRAHRRDRRDRRANGRPPPNGHRRSRSGSSEPTCRSPGVVLAWMPVA